MHSNKLLTVAGYSVVKMFCFFTVYRLRALSSGNSVTSPPPSPGPKYKMAEYRYGKEEMLAMFPEESKIPEALKYFDFIITNDKPQLPLSFIPLSEEEQVWNYSVNYVNFLLQTSTLGCMIFKTVQYNFKML